MRKTRGQLIEELHQADVDNQFLQDYFNKSDQIGTALQNDNLAGQDREITRLNKLIDNLEDTHTIELFELNKKLDYLWQIILTTKEN